jgi:hypothetical protein
MLKCSLLDCPLRVEFMWISMGGQVINFQWFGDCSTLLYVCG